MNRYLTILAVVALGIIAACWGKHRVSVPGTATTPTLSTIVGITTNAGVEVKFDQSPKIQDGKLVSKVRGKPYEIAVPDIQRYWVETRTFSTARTVGLVAGVAAAVVIVAVVATASAS